MYILLSSTVYEGGLKISYDDDVIFAICYFFTNGIQERQHRWKKCVPLEELCRKINLIWSHSMKISWSACELFSRLALWIFCDVSFRLNPKTKHITFKKQQMTIEMFIYAS